MKSAALVVYLETQFIELFRVAVFLRQSGSYKPLIIFARKYSSMQRDASICAAEGILCFVSTGASISPPPANSSLQKEGKFAGPMDAFSAMPADLFRRARGYISKTPIAFFFIYMRYIWEASSVRCFIEHEKPAILILAEESVGYTTSIWTKTAHYAKIPSVVIPYTVSNAFEAAETFFNNNAHSLERWDNRLISLLYPRWVFRYNGRDLLRLPAPYVLAAELLGLAPPSPWIPNSGYADAIIAESEFMEDYLIRAGLPESKLISTGTLDHDLLARNLENASALRDALYEELGLEPRLPMILCALPPDQHIAGRSESDFITYQDMVEFWIGSLSEVEGYNVVIKLHPRMKLDEMRYIEKLGFKITPRDTSYLIALCDIFVASVSATIRWAIACGKPTLNYDCYRYRYNDYIDAGGVITVEEKRDFVTVLHKLAENPAFHRKIASKQEACMNRWGNLDGKAGERMIQLLNRITPAKRMEE